MPTPHQADSSPGARRRHHDWPAVRDYPCWPGGKGPPRTGRIYDRNRREGPTVTTHSLDHREESIYGLLGPHRDGAHHRPVASEARCPVVHQTMSALEQGRLRTGRLNLRSGACAPRPFVAGGSSPRPPSPGTTSGSRAPGRDSMILEHLGQRRRGYRLPAPQERFQHPPAHQLLQLDLGPSSLQTDSESRQQSRLRSLQSCVWRCFAQLGRRGTANNP